MQEGETPFIIATQTSEQDIQQVLLEYGATQTPMVSHSQHQYIHMLVCAHNYFIIGIVLYNT